jgi:hypothetical protein
MTLIWLYCTKIWAHVLYPRLEFAESAAARLTGKENWSACPLSVGYPLTVLPISRFVLFGILIILTSLLIC